MAPKNAKFALFLMQQPPSAEVVQANAFKPEPDKPRIAVGQERSVTKGKDKKEVKGQILRTGTQAAMRLLRVTRDGFVVHEEEVPGTEYLISWHFATQFLKKARDRNLAEQDRLLYRQGPQGGSATEAVPIRTPIKRSREALDALQLQLDSLPCFEERHGDVKVNECSEVFMNGSLLHYYFKRYKDPTQLFKKILKNLLPRDILKADGYSLEGKCDSVAIPEKLVAAITAYVSLNTGADEDLFSPQTIVNSYVYYNRDEKFKRRVKKARHADADTAGSTEAASTEAASTEASGFSSSGGSPGTSTGSLGTSTNSFSSSGNSFRTSAGSLGTSTNSFSSSGNSFRTSAGSPGTSTGSLGTSTSSFPTSMGSFSTSMGSPGISGGREYSSLGSVHPGSQRTHPPPLTFGFQPRNKVNWLAVPDIGHHHNLQNMNYGSPAIYDDDLVQPSAGIPNCSRVEID